jgi:MoaA/NifB/PqqE/SkfB family radical SAM enzyme
LAGQSSYITPDKVFAHLDRLQAWRAGEKPAPVTIEWDLSNRCSRGCSFCHFAYTHTRGPLRGKQAKPEGASAGGDLADTELVIRALSEVAAAGVKGIVWTGGGEPTLHPDFNLITAYAAGVGLEQGMYTHGGHIGKQRAERIRDRFTWVVVSLDRADAESYRAYKGRGFEQSCEGIRLLAAADGPCVVGVSFLLDADTWRDAWRMLQLADGLGASYTTFRPMIHYTMDDPAMPPEDRSWITEAEPTLRELARTDGVVCDVDRFLMYRDWTRDRGYQTCYGIRMNATITPDGRVWVCPNRREFPNSCLGDLREESFAALWARHPGQWTDFTQCRAMCRLHLNNRILAAIEAPHEHTAFI